jgi:hypothetical protein
VFDAGFKDKTI